MPGKVLNRVLVNTQILAKTAGLLDIPVLKTEQYPHGLGLTHPTITEVLPNSTRAYEKLAFPVVVPTDFSARRQTWAGGR